MKYLLLIIAIFTLALPSHSSAESKAPQSQQDERVEGLKDRLLKALIDEDFDTLTQTLQPFIENNTITRHSTDMALAAFDLMIEDINQKAQKEETANYKPWLKLAEKWDNKQRRSWQTEFFLHRVKHAQAWYYLNEGKDEEITQSLRRQYTRILENAYTAILRIIDTYPDEWRTHSHVIENFDRYYLKLSEVEHHIFKINKMNANKLMSYKAHIKALSPLALGRDDTIIKKGIQNILRKYPNRNLSRPELIDDSTKQEIEDEIFEQSLKRILLTAQNYAQKQTRPDSEQKLMKQAYLGVNEAINNYYKNRPSKIKNHPLFTPPKK